MRNTPWILTGITLLFSIQLSCVDGGKNPDGDSDTDTDSDADSDTDADIDDPFDAIIGDEHICEEGDLYEDIWVVATTFYIGDYTRDGVDWEGKEYWLLYPNPTLEATGFTDCMMVWDAAGQEEEEKQGSCALCDFSVNIEASYNAAESTCTVQDFIDDHGKDWQETYDVNVKDGVSEFFFTSGTQFGTGQYNDERITYVSENDCKLF